MGEGDPPPLGEWSCCCCCWWWWWSHTCWLSPPAGSPGYFSLPKGCPSTYGFVVRSWTWPQNLGLQGEEVQGPVPLKHLGEGLQQLLWGPPHEAGCHPRRTPGPLRGCSGRSATRTRNMTIPCGSVGQRRRGSCCCCCCCCYYWSSGRCCCCLWLLLLVVVVVLRAPDSWQSCHCSGGKVLILCTYKRYLVHN